MKKSMKSLRQVNLFSGKPERVSKPKAKKPVIPTKEKYEKIKRTKALVRNFFENQLMLPVVNVVNAAFGKERYLPLLPDEILEKGLPDIVTKHRAFRVSDSIDDNLSVEATRRSEFKETWTDEHLLTIHSELLYESMMVLTYEGMPDDKHDVLAWIFASDYVTWHGRRVKVEHVPFSFRACCLLCQMDYTVLQAYVYENLELSSEYKQLLDYQKAA